MDAGYGSGLCGECFVDGVFVCVQSFFTTACAVDAGYGSGLCGEYFLGGVFVSLCVLHAWVMSSNTQKWAVDYIIYLIVRPVILTPKGPNTLLTFCYTIHLCSYQCLNYLLLLYIYFS